MKVLENATYYILNDMKQSESESWLRAIVDSSIDAVIVLDTQRTIRFANTAALAMAGQSGADSVIGMSYDDIVKQSSILGEDGIAPSPDTYPSTITLTEGRVVTGKIFEQVFRGRHSWLMISSFPIFDASGRTQYAIVRFADISERKHREDKLKFLVESNKILSITASNIEERFEQKARLTVPFIADWCTVNLVKGDGSISRIVVAHRNPEMSALVRELAERSFEESAPDSGVRHVIDTGIAEFYPDVSDTFLVQSSKSADRLAVARALGVTSAMILPIISHGTVLGVLSLAYAQSKRTYTQEDFEFMQEYCNHISIIIENTRLYEEIKRRDIAKDSFLAALSHELRNPLAPIKSAIELMKIEHGTPDIVESISIIEHQFDHLTKLLNDLLDVTRYSQGKIHMELNNIDLNCIIRNCVEAERPLLEKKKIDFETSLPSHPLVMRADQTRLEQALMNILHNAEKFTPSGGCIWIKVRHDERQATLVIGDTGSGIERDVIPHIFELGAHTKKSNLHSGGLGIGLVLVQEIVHAHGGTIRAHSKGIGRGSEFTITLPLLLNN